MLWTFFFVFAYICAISIHTQIVQSFFSRTADGWGRMKYPKIVSEIAGWWTTISIPSCASSSRRGTPRGELDVFALFEMIWKLAPNASLSFGIKPCRWSGLTSTIGAGHSYESSPLVTSSSDRLGVFSVLTLQNSKEGWRGQHHIYHNVHNSLALV